MFVARGESSSPGISGLLNRTNDCRMTGGTAILSDNFLGSTENTPFSTPRYMQPALSLDMEDIFLFFISAI